VSQAAAAPRYGEMEALSILQRRSITPRHPGVVSPSNYSCYLAISMARHLQFLARAFCVGAIIVVVAIASRRVYLRSAAEADVADADEEPATIMLIRCETMHDCLQNEHSLAVEADTRPRARCRES
jgi:hypothetical protein